VQISFLKSKIIIFEVPNNRSSTFSEYGFVVVVVVVVVE
jgi:hypothetical protein